MAISLKMSGKEVVNYNPTTDIATIKNTNIDSNVQFPAGHVIQVTYNQKTDRSAFSTTDWTLIPGQAQDGTTTYGFATHITPKKQNSKILITANLEGSGGENNFIWSARLYRVIGSAAETTIGNSDVFGTRPTTFMATGEQQWSNYGRNRISNSFLDTPNTLEKIYYYCKVWDTRDSGTVYINRQYYTHSLAESNFVYGKGEPTGTSSILLQEISQ